MFPKVEIVKQDISSNAEFFSRMTSYDFIARNTQSQEHYKRHYINSIISFTENEKNVIKDLTQKANLFTKRYSLLHNIQWNFVKLSKGIENDYPHTLLYYIMLPYNFITKYTNPTHENIKSLIKTLIHEKIHIFQRAHPEETRILIEDMWGFLPYKSNEDPLRRTNPDTNDLLYKRESTTCLQKYNNTQPHTLSDSSINKECKELYEHPYEQMAYILAELLVDNTFKTYDYINALKWLDIIHKHKFIKKIKHKNYEHF
jgi:hypothetical protein